MESKEIHSLENLRTEKELGISYNIDKITDNIFLGGIKGLSDSEYFKTEKITAILSLVKETPNYVEDENIKHKILPLEDLYSENITKYFKECIEFIENNGKVFVHCECGVSRSATIVLAYLMWKTHSTFNEAYSFVKKIRPEIDPNNGFRRQLKTFENLLKEHNYDLNQIDFESI